MMTRHRSIVLLAWLLAWGTAALVAGGAFGIVGVLLVWAFAPVVVIVATYVFEAAVRPTFASAEWSWSGVGIGLVAIALAFLTLYAMARVGT